MVKLQRPLARRALMTRLPLRVDIRFKNPCSRLRGMRFGCQVRFIKPFPLLSSGYLVDYSDSDASLSIVHSNRGRVFYLPANQGYGLWSLLLANKLCWYSPRGD